MKIAIYHGYELKGSGSNEYTRYLSKALASQGHEVHIICSEPNPEQFSFIEKATHWNRKGEPVPLFSTSETPKLQLHQLPQGDVKPVYITDKQREGNVKPFTQLSDEELKSYHALQEKVLFAILRSIQFDILHANHLIYQPYAAMRACRETKTPFVIFPHGSAIEYTIRIDQRYHKKAKEAILEAQGLVIGNREVSDRIKELYPEIRNVIDQKTTIVPIGVDTSLFQPVMREERRATIKKLIERAEKWCKGKDPSLLQELHREVENRGTAATQGWENRYNSSYPDKDFCEKMASIPWEHHILLFVGSLTVGKGVQTLIAALPALLQKVRKSELLIVGSGAYREVLETFVYAIDRGDKQLIQELVKRGKDLDRNDLTGGWDDVEAYISSPKNMQQLLSFGQGFAKKVHFTGRVDHHLLASLFPLADLAIFPSIIPEAYPLVLMESLSNGVLPMVSYFSGFKDGIDELTPHLGGLLTSYMKIPSTPKIRVEVLSTNIETLLQQLKKGSIKERLRNIALSEYDWQKRAKEMAIAYENIVKKSLSMV